MARILRHAHGTPSPSNTTALTPLRNRPSRATSGRGRRRGCRLDARSSRCRRSRRRRATAPREPKPSHILIALDGRRVADANSINALHARPVVVRIPVLEREVGPGRRRGQTVPKHAGPLLDGLVVVGRQQDRVHAAVVDLHPRAGPRVAGVHGFGCVGPVGLRGDHLAVGARRVPSVHRACVEAAGGDARVDDARGEHVWVGGCHHVLWGGGESAASWVSGMGSHSRSSWRPKTSRLRRLCWRLPGFDS